MVTKFRTVDKSRFWIEPRGAELSLWNLDSLSEAPGKGETLIFAEGEPDALSWLQAGAPYVVSVPNGAPERAGEGDVTPGNDRQFAYLWTGSKLHPDLAKFAPVKRWLHDVTQRMQVVFAASNLYNMLPIIYGDLGVFYAWGYLWPNVTQYARSMLRTETAVILFWVVPLAVAWRADGGACSTARRSLRSRVPHM